MTPAQIASWLNPSQLTEAERDRLYNFVEFEASPIHIMIATWTMVGTYTFAQVRLRKNISGVIGIGAGFKNLEQRHVFPLELVVVWAMNYVFRKYPFDEDVYWKSSFRGVPPIEINEDTFPEYVLAFQQWLNAVASPDPKPEDALLYHNLVTTARRYQAAVDVAYWCCNPVNMDSEKTVILPTARRKGMDMEMIKEFITFWHTVKELWTEDLVARKTRILKNRTKFSGLPDPNRIAMRMAEFAATTTTPDAPAELD